jgi:hypothetical protein
MLSPQGSAMRTYDKLIATIQPAKARGCLRSCLGDAAPLQVQG